MTSPTTSIVAPPTGIAGSVASAESRSSVVTRTSWEGRLASTMIAAGVEGGRPASIRRTATDPGADPPYRRRACQDPPGLPHRVRVFVRRRGGGHEADAPRQGPVRHGDPGQRRAGDAGRHAGHDRRTGHPPAAGPRASSPPRPKTNGSPPLRRTTSRPRARQADERGIDVRLWRGRAVAGLADVEAKRALRDEVEHARADEAIVDDGVRLFEEPAALAR